MPKRFALMLALIALSLSGCVVVEAVGTTARVAGSVVSTAVEVSGDVVGGAARTVAGGDEDDSD
nr:MAG: hypothetical protein E4H34_04840 [Hyphomicrobiales bacterium]